MARSSFRDETSAEIMTRAIKIHLRGGENCVGKADGSECYSAKPENTSSDVTSFLDNKPLK